MVKRTADARTAPGKVRARGKDAGNCWRKMLHQHAQRRWREVADCLVKGSPVPPRDDAVLVPLISELGAVAEEAISIIDRFAIGSAAEAFALGAKGAAPSEGFLPQLDLILDGFEQDDRSAIRQQFIDAENRAARGRPPVFQSDLWQLLHKVRESAELSYAREFDFVELDRRILFLLRGQGPLVPADLSAAVGVDKAQISRSVKRLLELGMIERDQIRCPVSLTAKGEAHADRLLRLAELRNRELSFDVSDKELSQFYGVMEILMDRAVVLYEHERDLAQAVQLSVISGLADCEPAAGIAERKAGEAVAVDRSRIVSPLLTLSAYFSRSAALAFKRLTGLSNFEAWVLSEIAYDPPTDWPRLVKALERDHSQAGRTVNHLIARGLVQREGKPGRRHGRFSPTGEGKRLYDIIIATSEQRSAFLMEPVAADQLELFLATFQKIRRNAAAQLERERAFEEFESS